MNNKKFFLIYRDLMCVFNLHCQIGYIGCTFNSIRLNL